MASFEGQEEDICFLLQEYHEKTTGETLDNGGEFDGDMIYALWDDCGNETLYDVSDGQLVGEVWIINSIKPAA